ncbi:Proton pump-interactor 2 [Acorus calamus]|uniref:Proton pump-interactor 2 n=1 Tax=Acorus calamus TaxID=4465 RepID=A0AAV9C3K0_ACOCL|nr:Proton pump-interactor 2 [Acorus calamus]
MTADCNAAVEFEGKIGPDPVSFDDPAVMAKKVPDNAVAEKTGFDADGSSLFVNGESDGSVAAAAEDGVYVAEMNAGDFSGDGSSDKEGEVEGLNGGYPDPVAPEVEVETDGTGEACVAAFEEVVPESINDEEPAVAEEESDDSGDAAEQPKLSSLGGEIDTVECPVIVFDESAVVVPELIKDEEPAVAEEESDDSGDADKVDAAEQPKLSSLGGDIDTVECPVIVFDESAVVVPELIKDEELVVAEEEAGDSADADIGEYQPTIVFDESLVVVPELIKVEEPVVAVEEADNSVDADKIDEAEQPKLSPMGGETDAIEYPSNGEYQPTIVFDESPVIAPELIKDEEPVVVEEEAKVDAIELLNLSPLGGEINAVEFPSNCEYHSTTDMVSAVECPLSGDDQSNIVCNEAPLDGEDQSTIVDSSNCEEQLTVVPDAASVDKVMVVECPFKGEDQPPNVCDEAPVEEEVLVDECPFNGEDQLTTGHDENSVDKALMVKCPITGEDQSPIVCDESPVVDKALVIEHPLNGEDQSTTGHDDTSVDEKLVFEFPLNAEDQPSNVFYEVSMVEEVSVVNNQSTIVCDRDPVVNEALVIESSVDGEEEPRVVDVVPIEEPAEEVMEPKVETTYFSIGSLEFETVIINGSPAVRGVKLSYMPADDMDLGRSEVCNKNECLNSSPVEDDDLSNSPFANLSVGTAFVTETVAEGDLGQQEIENRTAVVINEMPEISDVKLSDATIDDSKLESLKVGNENEGFGNSIVDEVLSGSVDVVTIEVAQTGPASAEVTMGIENSPVCSVDSVEVESTVSVCDGPIESCSQMVNVYKANNVDSCSIEDRELVSEAVVLPVEEVSALPVNDSKVGEDELVPKGKSINIDTECNRSANTADDGKPIAEEAINVDTAVQSLSEETNDRSDMEKKGPFYIIRVPRFEDGKLRERENILQARVDEFTESRDIVGARLNEQKNIQKRCWDELVAVRLEESAARDALNKKNDELEPVRARMKMLKCAMDIDEISDKIRRLEHKMQHETIPFDEEKQLLREIKRLKSDREQRRMDMGSKAELQGAFEQREEINKRFQVLSQEHETLKSALSRRVAISRAAWKRHDDESKNFQIFRVRHKAANDLRQEEYMNLQKLKSERSEKNAVFYKYRDDKNLIRHYLSTGDREKLLNHCRNQVERTMELWNQNDAFRNEYVKNNMPSTLRRLGTPDGCSLGPDEQPHIHVNPVIYYKVSSTVPTPTLETVHDNAAEKTKSESTPKDAEKSRPAEKPKAPEKVAVVVESIVLDAVSKGGDVEEEKEKERKPTKEEEEAARKAAEQARKEEELRKEKAAAELKEQHRLEQKAKAKEAEERKRRAAEKAQAKADLKAKLEAEQREKQREKRQRKKERKRAAAAGSVNAVTEGEITSETESSQSEIPPPFETRDKAPAPTTVTKKSTKPPVVVKQTKVRPLPPPLRNRNKRKLQTWIWVAVIALALVVLVLASNYGYPMKLGLPNFHI